MYHQKHPFERAKELDWYQRIIGRNFFDDKVGGVYSDKFTLPSGVVLTWEERKHFGVENLTYEQACRLFIIEVVL